MSVAPDTTEESSDRGDATTKGGIDFAGLAGNDGVFAKECAAWRRCLAVAALFLPERAVQSMRMKLPIAVPATCAKYMPMKPVPT
jgi:hypothetical protein